MRDYSKIIAWQRADDLTVAVYEVTRKFPREELYGLTSQLRRAASSTAANIAEGASRNTRKDYLHFLYVARGSLAETQYFVHLSRRLGYLSDPVGEQMISQTRSTFAVLHGLIAAVEKESSVVSKVAARISSFAALALPRLLIGP